jgi:hypothetical protein
MHAVGDRKIRKGNRYPRAVSVESDFEAQPLGIPSRVHNRARVEP